MKAEEEIVHNELKVGKIVIFGQWKKNSKGNLGVKNNFKKHWF